MRNYSCRYSPGFTPGSLLLQLHDFEIAIPKSDCKGINIFYFEAQISTSILSSGKPNAFT